ncbi:MAG: hypothetical protein AABX47_06310 [Nanoarchaeota archaeon]
MEPHTSLKGKFIMIEGIDKGGKGTAAAAIREWLTQNGLKVFDMNSYQKETHHLPQPDKFDGYDVVASSEPTYCWSGLDLREEHLRNNNHGSTAHETAEGFSFNRGTLYRRCLMPALDKGLIWVQERGVVTSLMLQPIQASMNGDSITRDHLMGLAGNRFALSHPPHILMIVHCDPQVAVSRTRIEKEDDSFFEKIEYMNKIAKNYRDPWLKEHFSRLGSKVVEMDTTNLVPQETRDQAVELVKRAVS